MASPHVVRFAPNPADPSSGLRLWSTGLIQAVGNAVAPSDWEPTPEMTFGLAIDLVVIDHLTPSGYVLAQHGPVSSFGGVTPAANFQNTGSFHIWRKLTMNPAGNGQGYEWTVRGTAYRFGPTLPPNLGGSAGTDGATNLAGGIDWAADLFADVALDWASKRYMELATNGDFYHPSFGITLDPDDPRPPSDGRKWYRWLSFVDPTLAGTPKGYIGTYDGTVYGFNSAAHVTPVAQYPSRNVVVDGHIVSDGLAGRPLILETVANSGQLRRIVESSAPTAMPTIEPVSPVTTTTRPEVRWTYVDLDGDAQAQALIKVFSSAQYSAPGWDVEDSEPLGGWNTTDSFTFSQPIDFDLPNATYRAYVRVRDSAGDWSIWGYTQFVVNVTPPPAPVVDVDADSGTWTTTVSVEAGSGTASGLSAELSFSDDGGTTWETVVGGTALAYPTSGAKIVETPDHQPPFNSLRSYRARTVSLEPRLTSDWSAVVDAILISDEWAITNASTGEGMAASVTEWSDSRETGAAAHYPLGRGTAVVTRTGMQAATLPLNVRTMDAVEHADLEALLTAGTTLLLRNPFGEALYVALVGQIERSLIDGVAPAPGDAAEMAYAHLTRFDVAVVDRPEP